MRPRKAPTAFRTISEVSDDLHIPQHVLRFWETKFPQLKPLKRGGGRRYYRPEDIALLRRISDLLYTQGYTIKGVQRLLREGGLEGAAVPGPAAGSETHGELPLGDGGTASLYAQADPAAAALREALEALEAIARDLRALAAGGGGRAGGRSEA
nr:MerR family transcriptional regulator [Caldovatus aquaticus]